MPRLIEIHALQTLAPNNLNRDDTGAPKSAMFGGVPRTRLSSQSQKRPMRLAFNEEVRALRIKSTSFSTLYGEKFVEMLGDRVVAKTDPLAFLNIYAKMVAIGGGSKDSGTTKGDDDDKADTKGAMALLSQAQIEKVLEDAAQAYPKKPTTNSVKKPMQELYGYPVTLDIAAFGRMVASNSQSTVEGAVQVAHAISVGTTVPESDYFIAAEDPQAQDLADNAGGGFLGETAFASQTYYRYAAIDLDLLARNLQGSGVDIADAVSQIVNAFVKTLPNGRQNTYAAKALPNLVVITEREGQPESWAGAFEKAVLPNREVGGYLEGASRQLTAYVNAQRQAFGTEGETLVVKAAPGLEVDGLGTETTLAGAVDSAVAYAIESL